MNSRLAKERDSLLTKVKPLEIALTKVNETHGADMAAEKEKYEALMGEER